MAGGVDLFLGLLLLFGSSSTAVHGERNTGSVSASFTTPLSTATRLSYQGGEREARQRTDRQAVTCPSETLQQRLAEIQCDADYLNALADVENAQCSYPITFRLARLHFTVTRGYPECATDKNGMLCGEHDSAQDTPRAVADIIDDCLARPGNCSERCKSMLESFASRFDCCIHSLDITEGEHLVRVLTPQLWDDCGVTRPEPCGNGPSELAPLSTNVSCSYSCTIHQSQALFCKYQATDVIGAYRDCGNEMAALRVAQTCGFNERGDFCGSLGSTLNYFSFLFGSLSNEPSSEYLLQIYDKCVEVLSSGRCPAECREALSQARDTFGCCLNNFNETGLGSDVLSLKDSDFRNFVTNYFLWSTCVLEPPGFCQLPTDPSNYDRFTQCGVCEFHGSSGSGSDFPLVVVVGAVSAGLLLFLVALATVILYCCCRKRRRKNPPINKTTEASESQQELPSPPHQSNPGGDVERVGTIHYYDYIKTQNPNKNHQERDPAPLPPLSTSANMTTNIAYDRIPSNQDPSERYRIPFTLPRGNGTSAATDGGTNWSDGPTSEGGEYIAMVSNPAHTTNSSQLVMYI